jgi:uncharacterized membrane protein
MSDLVVIEFPSEQRAEEVRNRLFELQRDYLINLGDAVIATKTSKGQIKLNQVLHPAMFGAVQGSFVGLVLGALFFVPLFGVVFGAAAGAISGALDDVGIDDRFAKRVAQSIDGGNAALFLLIKSMTTDKVLSELEGAGGKVLQTSLDQTKEAALRTALATAVASHQPSTPPVGESPSAPTPAP